LIKKYPHVNIILNFQQSGGRMIVHIITDNDKHNKMVYFCVDDSVAKIGENEIHQLARNLSQTVSPGQPFVHYTLRDTDSRAIEQFKKREGVEFKFERGKLWVHPELDRFRRSIFSILLGITKELTVD
jgi:hypothetical protein